MPQRHTQPQAVSVPRLDVEPVHRGPGWSARWGYTESDWDDDFDPPAPVPLAERADRERYARAELAVAAFCGLCYGAPGGGHDRGCAARRSTAGNSVLSELLEAARRFADLS